VPLRSLPYSSANTIPVLTTIFTQITATCKLVREMYNEAHERIKKEHHHTYETGLEEEEEQATVDSMQLSLVKFHLRAKMVRLPAK
jgi:hypothetical protein